MRCNRRMQFCKIEKGLIATEFVLALPWICAALFVFVKFILFLMGSQQAVYAGFMADRAALQLYEACMGEDNPLPQPAGGQAFAAPEECL